MKKILSYSILLLFISSCISKKRYAELEAKNKELQYELEHPIEENLASISLDMLIIEEFLDAKDQQFENFLSRNIVFDDAFNVEKAAEYDMVELKRLQEQIKAMEDSDTYFFVQSATLTIGSGRTFNSSKFNKDINSIYFTAKGKVYKTNEQIKNERIITVELISLKDMLL